MVFDAAEITRAVRPLLDHAPTAAEVTDTLEALTLPVLGGVITVGENAFQVGVAGRTVMERLAQLAEATRAVEDDQLRDRY